MFTQYYFPFFEVVCPEPPRFKFCPGRICLYKAKVLIIDDDPALLSALKEYIQHEGHAVTPAPNLKAAYDALENDAPDLAILDYQLPDGDALQFLSAIKTMNL